MTDAPFHSFDSGSLQFTLLSIADAILDSLVGLTLLLLQSNSHLPKKCFIYFNKNLLKRMKNAFYFILKALFVLIIFGFLS